MSRRDFPGHSAWTETRINGDHVLAFVAIRPNESHSEPSFHQVFDHSYFARHSDAVEAANQALSMLLRIDELDQPVFSSADC